MKKEDYINQMNDICRREFELRRERGALKDKYIKESEIYQKFKVGEKVMAYINDKPVPAFVNGFEINAYSNNEVILSLVHCKRDGKSSKKKLLYVPDCGDRVEKTE